MLTLLITAVKRARAAHRRRAELVELLKKDDRTLDDIGLNRADIISALGLPPEQLLANCVPHGSQRSLALDGLR